MSVTAVCFCRPYLRVTTVSSPDIQPVGMASGGSTVPMRVDIVQGVTPQVPAILVLADA